MINHVEYLDYSFLQAALAEVIEVSLLSLLENQIHLPIEQVDSWHELKNQLEVSGDLFVEDQKSSKIQIFRLEEKLEYSQEILEFLTSLESQIYLIRPDKKITAAEKKLLKKFKAEVLDLKKLDPQLGLKVVQEYTKKYDFEIDSKLQKLVLASKNYLEIINLLDLVRLSGGDSELIQSLEPEFSLPIFMRQFTVPADLNKLKPWFDTVPEEVQLYLSVCHTKLAKQNSVESSKIRKNLILTDAEMKTDNTLDSLTKWKLFLYQVARKV
jgi:hypothetical protein